MPELNQDLIKERHYAENTVDVANADSAVSWPAIFAGAAGAAALSLLLMILGTGLGFSVISPWHMEGVSASTFGWVAIVWLSCTQLAASGLGGYLAGRLRTKWRDIHTDEVYFRDTAHGFLTWAIASLLTAVIMASAATSIGSGVRAGAEVVGETAGAVVTGAMTRSASESGESDNEGLSLGYFIDSLFRSDNSVDAAADAQINQPAPPIGAGQETPPPVNDPLQQQSATTTTIQPERAQAVNQQPLAKEKEQLPGAEVRRIFARALYDGSLLPQDKEHLARLIAQHSNLTRQQAEQRVDEVFSSIQTMQTNLETTAREAADKARKATAYAALWMTIALLMGAFVASLTAVFGGRQRDIELRPHHSM